MVEKLIEPEVEQVLDCIKNKKDFILTGGAGSGKTYSLITLLQEVSRLYPSKSIICITYTNNAVSEIESRVSNKDLYVATIHKYLWKLIEPFQKEIKETIVELINNNDIKNFAKPIDLGENDITLDYFKGRINYDEYYRINREYNSTISHDQLLILAERMIEKYLKLRDIIIDTADFIFVDEYQDTSELLLKILLTHLKGRTKKNTIGFFGDSMQAIYDEGIGEINNPYLKRIDKKQNRRNPKKIIELANKFRTDDIYQVPSEDLNAPNMEDGEVIEGNVKFIYGNSLNLLYDLKRKEIFQGWDFNNGETTKELHLVHRGNAAASGFDNLFELYKRDLILDLIKKIKRKENKGTVSIDSNEEFESVIAKANIQVGKGLYKEKLHDLILKQDNLSDLYKRILKEKWNTVKLMTINTEALFAFKYDPIANAYTSTSNRDIILRRLDEIYRLIKLYEDKNYNTFLRITKRTIRNIEDKKRLKEDLNFFDTMKKTSIQDIISSGSRLLNIPLEEEFEEFIRGNGKYLWERIKKISFEEYINLVNYCSETLPFATQHSVKGSEYDNVLVILDNYNWTKYNFNLLFDPSSEETNVKKRTRKLFYVCITRAKRNLIVYMPTDKPSIINKAKNIFGEDNVFNGNEL